jgi:hypothetical protein
MYKVTPLNADCVETHLWVTDASSLEFPVGRFPKIVDTDLGNRQPFIFQGFFDGTARYLQGNGCLKLHVFND